MATIQSSIMLMDGMSRPLVNIVGAINSTISALQSVNDTNVRFDTTQLTAARQAIIDAGVELNQVQNEIQDNINKQNEFNDSLRQGANNANGLISSIKKMALAYMGMQSIRKGINLSDTLTQNTARLNLMNDGNQTTEELRKMIFDSAQRSRGNFLDMQSTVSKLGILAPHAFNSNKETVAFAELIAKSFKVGGSSQQEQSAGMYQLTQAMASGKLQGDEFRSIMENAPMLAQVISRYTGQSVGKLKELSKEGLITSEVIKNAMFAAVNQINEKFASIPMTFNDHITSLKSNAIKDFSIISDKLSSAFNSERFVNFINSTSNFITGVMRVGSVVVSVLTTVGAGLYETWGIIQSFAIATLGLFTVYKGVLTAIAIKTALVKGMTLLYNLALIAKSVALGAVNTGLITTTAAQWGLNAAMLASPITWIVAGFALVIAAIYAGVAAYNKLTGASKSATGMIVGSVFAMGAIIKNVFVGFINYITATFISIANFGIGIAEFFANVFKNPIKATAHLFLSFINFLIDKVKSMAEIIDAVVGTSFVSKIENMKAGMSNWVNNKIGPNDVQLERIDTKKYMLERTDVSDMYNSGYDKGANFKLNNPFENVADYNLDNTNALLGQIAGNTSKSNEKLDLTTEEIKYLRDVAEMEAINRFTTAEVKVEVGGINNHISSALDLDDITNGLIDKMSEGLSIAAEGAYS